MPALPDMTFPDYHGRSLVNLMASLRARFTDQSGDYAPLQTNELALGDYDQIVLLVIDGLGFHYLKESLSWLKHHCLQPMTSVFPSTTAASITTFLTGVAPQQHGLTGWFTYLAELEQVTTVLPCMPRGSQTRLSEQGIDIGKLYGHPIFFDQFATESYIVSPNWILHTDFNRAHTGKANTVGYETLNEMCEAIAHLLTSGERQKYIYAYWSEFDHLSHVHGNNSVQVKQHFAQLSTALDRMLKQSRGRRSLILITADHGFIDTSADKMITINDHPRMHECLRLPLCGEPRTAYCYVHPDKEEQFCDYVNNEFSDQIEIITGQALIEQGVFGLGEPHPDLINRVGDYALLMKDNFVIKDWLESEQRFFHPGVHGGTSELEMHVPLIVLQT